MSFFSISGEPQQLKHRQLQQQQQLKPGQQLAERQQQLQPFGLGGATVRTNGKKERKAEGLFNTLVILKCLMFRLFHNHLPPPKIYQSEKKNVMSESVQTKKKQGLRAPVTKK